MDAIKSLDAEKAIARDAGRQRWSTIGRTFLALLGIGVALLVLSTVLLILVKGIGSVNLEFLTQQPRENMSKGGIAPMILGSFYLLVGTLALTLPIGILGGVYLAEYAGTKRWVGTLKATIMSLAGTPSIIYGLFGFAVFVLMVTKKATLMAGILTLATMAVPIVVLSTEAAIRAVPQSQIEGSYALGLTRWQTIWRVILPQAMPGILTGVILASGRAMGEAPPILLTAGIFYTTIQPSFGQILNEPVMNLPYHVTEAIKQTTAFTEAQVWGTCLVLLGFMLVLNLTAIILRSRSRRIRVGG